jgi:hypothetical protein
LLERTEFSQSLVSGSAAGFQPRTRNARLAAIAAFLALLAAATLISYRQEAQSNGTEKYLSSIFASDGEQLWVVEFGGIILHSLGRRGGLGGAERRQGELPQLA